MRQPECEYSHRSWRWKLTRIAANVSLLSSALLVGTDARAADQRQIYARYMDFPSLVDRCDLPVQFLPDGMGVAFPEGAPPERILQRVDAATGKRTPLLDTTRLRTAVTRALGYEPPHTAIPFDDFTFSGNAIEFALEGARFRLDRTTYSIERLPTPESNEGDASARARLTPRPFEREAYLVGSLKVLEKPSPDRQWYASLKDGNIWLRGTVDGRSMPLTSDGTADVSWDIETAERDPWSPDGLRLFAVKYDRTRVPKRPTLHLLQRNKEVSYRHFQMAGAPLDRGEVFIVPVLGQPPVRVDIGDTNDQYFRLLGWLRDPSEVWFARFTRDFGRVDVIAANAATGVARTIMSESSKTFVRLQHDVIWGGDAGFAWLPSGAGYLWLSERDGWNHLYLYDLKGRLQRQLTRGNFPVHDVVAVDEAGGWVYFTASEEPRPYDIHLYRAPLKGGAFTRLTAGEGVHQVRLAPSMQFFVDSFSSVRHPPRVELRRNNGTLIEVLHQADTRRLRDTGWVPPEEFQVKAADGVTELWGVLYKPDDFDSKRRYPLVENIYGGPQTSNLTMTFCGSNARQPRFVQALAKTGFIVVVVAGRGTPGRSKAFQDVVYKEWADHVIADHAGALRQLIAARPYLDAERVGIFGRSWGGYFAFRALTDVPDLYRAAVSIVPGFDPYDGILYEPYLGLPEFNRDVYEAASAFRLAPKVQGDLLMIGGTLDVATYSDILRMAGALIDAKVHHELLLVPNQGHLFSGPAAEFANAEVIRFLQNKLRQAKESPSSVLSPN